MKVQGGGERLQTMKSKVQEVRI